MSREGVAAGAGRGTETSVFMLSSIIHLLPLKIRRGMQMKDLQRQGRGVFIGHCRVEFRVMVKGGVNTKGCNIKFPCFRMGVLHSKGEKRN